MIYWIEDIKDGSFVGAAPTLIEAVTIQHTKYMKGIDTYIRKEG